MRAAIVVVGGVATYMALTVKSIYGLWYLSSDLVYVILFPQLVCVVYFKRHCNTYGSLCAYIIGFLLRAAGGEDIMGLPPIIKYPFYNKELGGQLFPFRTFAMISSLTILLSVSTLAKKLFESGRLPAKYDIFHCIVNIPDDAVVVQEPLEGELSVLNLSIAKSYQASEMNGRINPGLVADDEDDDDSFDNRTSYPDGYASINEIRARPSTLTDSSVASGKAVVTKL